METMKQCGKCKFSNPHGSWSNCQNKDAVKFFADETDGVWLFFDHESKKDFSLASRCPYYSEYVYPLK